MGREGGRSGVSRRTWFIIRSSDSGFTVTGWGRLPPGIPDYDGDGKTDIAVYRDGIWFILRSSDGTQATVGWGGADWPRTYRSIEP